MILSSIFSEAFLMELSVNFSSFDDFVCDFCKSPVHYGTTWEGTKRMFLYVSPLVEYSWVERVISCILHVLLS